MPACIQLLVLDKRLVVGTLTLPLSCSPVNVHLAGLGEPGAHYLWDGQARERTWNGWLQMT